MTTRRSFCASAALAPVALAAVAPNSPITKLKSRRAEAQPITPAERRARIERAQQLMAAARIDSICLTGGTSLEYFSGVRWGNSERLFIMVIPARGEPFFIAPNFEEERAREQISSGSGTSQAHVFTWHEDESPYALVAASLKERGLATGKLGMEETVKFVFADGVGKALPAAGITSATPVTAGCRMIKSPAEIALMRLASSVTLQAYEAAWKSVRDGMTQQELGSLIGAAYQALGFPGFASVQVGEFSALPHGSALPQKIREGAIVLIDDGCRVEGYQSDISRAMVLGKPTARMRRIFEIVRQAQSAPSPPPAPASPASRLTQPPAK